MARVAFALIFVVASEDVTLADFDDDGLSLLQLASRRSGELEHELEHHRSELGWGPWNTGYGLQPKPQFGPDGTWATPYCKDIQGCDEPYCVPGCNGGAYWEGMPYDNDRLNVKWRQGWHFLACVTGSPAGTATVPPAGGVLRCLNSENSTKPAYWSPVPDEIDTRMRPKVGAKFGMEAYGKEFCPDDCVNDCAAFKWGHFLWCGSTGGAGAVIYDRQNSNNGPNRQCEVGKVNWIGAMVTTTWCGERTTTTPLPPVPEEGLEELEVQGEPADEGDDAAAVGDPHIRTSTGRRYDLE